ncbi:Uncharacterised protein [Serratia liquefaciens]|nr:Uncharacterised protein [Serratia liquefaciens]
MIVRDDSERGIPPLVTHQPPSSLDDAPVIRGRMVQIPGWIIRCTPDYLSRSAGLAASSGVTRHRRKRCPCRWRMRRFCR